LDKFNKKMKTYKKRKGIILAGGLGTRLYPATKVVSKQLLMVYDKPLIYYPLSTLMLANIREVLIITTPKDINIFKKLLGSGKEWGMKLDYAVQKKPKGLPQAFSIGKKFIGKDDVALILGDNIFYGSELLKKMNNANNIEQASIFAYQTINPERYGVISFNKNNKIEIEEKPIKPKSNLAITGLYFFNNNVIDLVKKLKPSRRGELEITDLIKIYLKSNQLNIETLGRGFAWLDTGSFDSMLDASSFVRTIQDRQGLIISSPEEISYRNGWINNAKLNKIAYKQSNNNYKDYLLSLIN